MRQVRRRVTWQAMAAVMLLAAGPTGAKPQAPSPTATVHARADSALADSARALFAARGIPGGQVVVLREGRPVLQLAIGLADVASGRAVTDTTLFRVGSVSKLFTATGAALLWERGRLDLDAPVSALVPEFPSRHSGVTPRRLAGHLGGIRHYAARDFTRAAQRYPDVIDALAIFVDDSLVAPPGTRYLYSSYGYNLLGAAAQRAARATYARLLDSLVLTPLRLPRTQLERGQSDADVATGYAPSSPTPRVVTRTDLSDRWPSGGLLSTAAEIARFAESSVRGPWLGARVRTLLFTPMRTAGDSLTNVGFGWRVGTDRDGRVVYHHGGASEGGRAMLMVWRDESLVVAITTNLSNARIAESDAMALGRLAAPPR